jgi:glycolate oxidase FAD binding subunit
MSDVVKTLSETIRAAAAARSGVRLRGGGTKDFYGQSLEGEVLDPRGHDGIVAYEPTELVVTARCGTRLVALESKLNENGQMLAFEPPRFGDQATVGGAVAAGLSGPRRQAAGAVRDFVLGVRILDGRGRDLSFGGQVMKNVAGYDVSRLMAGSLGTLGLILEVSLKVLPIPVAETTVRLELPEEKALEAMNRWGGKPLPVSATAWAGGDLWVRLSGAEAAVRAAREKIGGEVIDGARATAFWSGVREHTEDFFRGDAPMWRVSVPSTAAPLGLPGNQLIEWGGSLRWFASAADARLIRELAAKAGGHATLFRGGDKAAGVFTPLAPAIARIHANLKREFDPEGVLNRGRMYPDL